MTMHLTLHALQRMNQRGITKEMIELVLEYGNLNGSKIDLDQEALGRLVKRLQRELKIAKKLLDKGGVTVVAAEGSSVIVTTYNIEPPRKIRKWKVKENPRRLRNCAEREFRTRRRNPYEQ